MAEGRSIIAFRYYQFRSQVMNIGTRCHSLQLCEGIRTETSSELGRRELYYCTRDTIYTIYSLIRFGGRGGQYAEVTLKRNLRGHVVEILGKISSKGGRVVTCVIRYDN